MDDRDENFGWYSGHVPPIPGTLEAVVDSDAALAATIGEDIAEVLLGQTGFTLRRVMNALVAGPNSAYVDTDALEFLNLVKSGQLTLDKILKAQADICEGPYQRSTNEEELAKQGVLLGKYADLAKFLDSAISRNRDLFRIIKTLDSSVFPDEIGLVSREEFIRKVVSVLAKEGTLSTQDFWKASLLNNFPARFRRDIAPLMDAFAVDQTECEGIAKAFDEEKAARLQAYQGGDAQAARLEAYQGDGSNAAEPFDFAKEFPALYGFLRWIGFFPNN